MAKNPPKPALDPADRAAQADRSLVRPPKGPKHSNDSLHHVVRLALLSQNEAERRLVGAAVYRRIALSKAAAVAGLSPARAEEVLESLDARERIALSQLENDERLARWNSQKGRRRSDDKPEHNDHE